MRVGQNDPKPVGKELSPEIRELLILIGRGLGSLSVYGPNHPSVKLILSQAHGALQNTLKTGSFSIGSFNGALTVNDAPVEARELPIKALEKRLATMKVSHISLLAGLTEDELSQLLDALCATSDDIMRAILAKSKIKNIDMEDVKYVTLRSGEKKTGKGDGDGADEIPSTQINQVAAFLKGQTSGASAAESIKKAIADPETLGKVILETSIRQTGTDLENGESLTDTVIDCLQRTYETLRTQPEYQGLQGKVNLTKAMMALDKALTDKVQRLLNNKNPGMSRQIVQAIRKMQTERQFDMLSTHYEEQCLKREKTEKTIVELIKQLGPEKAREQLMASNIPVRDWQRLITKSSTLSQNANLNAAGGVDISLITTVLDKLDGLLEMNPAGAKTAVLDARQGFSDYTFQIESQIHEIEIKVQESEGQDRDKLLLEISKLTLSLMQPLTVINGSIEAAMITADPALHKDLLELAFESGQSLAAMTKRMIELTDYPELNEADDHLNEWH